MGALTKILFFLNRFRKTWILILGPIGFILSVQLTEIPIRMLYILVLMALYWMTEALPLPITSLIPLAGMIDFTPKQQIFENFAVHCLYSAASSA